MRLCSVSELTALRKVSLFAFPLLLSLSRSPWRVVLTFLLPSLLPLSFTTPVSDSVIPDGSMSEPRLSEFVVDVVSDGTFAADGMIRFFVE